MRRPTAPTWLPNVMTLGSVFCGFYAIVLCTSPDPDALLRAAWAIIVGGVLDLLDGRVARHTRTHTPLGRQLDSLADIVSFGTAPAVLLYVWALDELGLAGLLIAFGYLGCGALRLARFNVLASQDAGETGREDATRGETEKKVARSPVRSVGLPIPPAAGLLSAIVLFRHRTPPVGAEAIAVGVIVAALGVLMISRVRFRTFKDFAVTRSSAALLIVFVGGRGLRVGGGASGGGSSIDVFDIHRFADARSAPRSRLVAPASGLVGARSLAFA